MLFYQFDQLDNFIKSDLIHSLESEKEEIKKYTNLYQNKKMNLLSITTNMIAMSDSLDKNKLESFYQTISLLKQSFETIHALQEVANGLEENLTSTISLSYNNLENNYDEIKANLVEYNKQREELSHKILSFETDYTSIINSTILFSLSISNAKKGKKKILTSTPIKMDTQLKAQDYNKLIISEKDQKAYLPYFYSDVKKIYETSNHQYLTLQSVVDDLYVVPLERFKNSSLSRFKEAFHLMREKENESFLKALDLSLELMFQYELNPIIISACRNLKELDLYLTYLEDHETEKFPCFEIEFKVAPQCYKNHKKSAFSF